MSQVILAESGDRPVDRPDGGLESSPTQAFLKWLPLLFVLIHAPLGAVMNSISGLATAHAAATVALAAYVAIIGKRVSHVVYMAAYIGTADVLWRGTDASVPWEISKYGIVLLCGAGLYRFGGRILRPVSWVYLALLVPSSVVTLLAIGFAEGREDVSFNISGPLSLAVAFAFMSYVKLDLDELRNVVFAAAAPIAGVCWIAFTAFLKVEEFTDESSKEAAGGFGPNQVSTILSFGAVILVLMAMKDPVRVLRIFEVVIGVAFLTQSTLTFSRGGLYNFVIAFVFVLLVYIRRPSRILLALVAAALLWGLLGSAIGIINDSTGGAFVERFTNSDVTGRDRIAEGDLRVFNENMLVGVGPGQTDKNRSEPDLQGRAAHTEFTRLLGEHGLLGLAAIACLGRMVFLTQKRRNDLWERAWALGLVVWSFAAMGNASMRLAAMGLAMGLAALHFQSPIPQRDRPRSRAQGSKSAVML